MRLAITAHVTIFYEVETDGGAAELCDNIENGIQFLVDNGLLTEGVQDAEYLSFETTLSSDFAALLPAAEHIEDILDDLRSLGHYTGHLSDDAAIIRAGRDQTLVDADGMYDPAEAARQYANTILEQGI